MVPGGRDATVSLVGRARELDAGQHLIGSLLGGQGTVVAVTGEAGIGKSTLVRRWCEDARDAGVDVLVGGCDDLEALRPFGPLVRLVAVEITDADQAADALEERAGSGGLLVVLEDLQWADPSTVLALHRVVERCGVAPIALVVTARPSPRPTVVHRLLASLPSGSTLDLEPFNAAETASLIEALTGRAPSPAEVARLAGAGGNPLFLTELLRAGPAGDGDTAPRGFADIVLGHLRFLSPDALDVLRMASVLGAAFEVIDLSRVLDTPPSALDTALREAADAGLLMELGASLVFRHDVVRHAVYASHSESMRRALHLQAAERLATSGAAVDRVATHFRLGASVGNERAIQWILRAATEAATYDAASAARLLGAVIELLPPSDRRRARLLVEQAFRWFQSSRLTDALDAGLAAQEAGAGTEVEWHARLCLAMLLLLHGRVAEAQVHHAWLDAQAASGPIPRIVADTVAASLRARQGDFAGARALAEETLALATLEGESLAAGFASSAVALTAILQGDWPVAIDAARTADELADAPAPESIFWTATPLLRNSIYLVLALVFADDFDTATALLHQRQHTNGRSAADDNEPVIHHMLAAVGFFTGDWDDGLAEFDVGLRIGAQVGSTNNRLVGVLAAIGIAAHRGDRARVRALLDIIDAAETAGELQGWEWWLAALGRGLAALLDGDAPAAVEVLSPAWALMTAVDGAGFYPLFTTYLVPALLEVGDHAGATAAVDHLERATQRSGGVASTEGLYLRLRGLVEQDPALSLAAVDAYRGSPRPLDRARASEDAGTVLAASDPDRAAALLTAANDAYEALGADADARRVAAALRRLGRRAPASRTTRTRATAGWNSLTTTEARVVDLLSDGLTNRRIAETLFVSTRTVDTHVRHIFTKLGLNSRAAVAAEAVRHRHQGTSG